MIKINIKKQNIITNSATFSTQEEVDAWLASCEAKESFGKPEHTIELTPRSVIYHEEIPAVIENEVEISPAIPAWIETIEATYETIPSEYSVEIVDITEETNEKIRLETQIAKGNRSKMVCDRALDLIRGYNSQLSDVQILTMMESFRTLNELLINGWSTKATDYVFNIVPDEVLITTQMKNDVLSVLGGN